MQPDKFQGKASGTRTFLLRSKKGFKAIGKIVGLFRMPNWFRSWWIKTGSFKIQAVPSLFRGIALLRRLKIWFSSACCLGILILWFGREPFETILIPIIINGSDGKLSNINYLLGGVDFRCMRKLKRVLLDQLGLVLGKI